ncbi:DUF6233 domain-containing protein [Streptomyces prunicolor]|uniref:DUF6233 domain-containing protein n=1 Tax=Streptomyces prunicolor TaxID=67348 RepID=UPI00386F755D|nr:DUF6233 domain-containing protein [Streptomyces prunicolor]
MNDGSLSRLDVLRFLERVQARDLARTRRWIADEERREVERQRGLAARAPDPDWLIERGLSGRTAVYIHKGGCYMVGSRSNGVELDQALRALAEGIAPCPHCRPDNALGFFD